MARGPLERTNIRMGHRDGGQGAPAHTIFRTVDRCSSQVFLVFFKNRFLSERPDGVRTSGAPFFLPFFLPCFPLCPIFFIFRSNFAFWVTSSNVSLDIHGLILIQKGARAITCKLPPASPSSIFLGGKISHFFARSLRGLCHFCGPIFGNVFLALQSSRNPVSLANRSRKQRVSH